MQGIQIFLMGLVFYNFVELVKVQQLTRTVIEQRLFEV